MASRTESPTTETQDRPFAAEGDATTDGAAATRGETGGAGVDPNVLGALAYLFSPLTGVVVYLVAGEDRFARFHAAQSVVFGGGLLALYVALTTVQLAIAFVPRVGGLFSLLFSLVYPIVGLAAFGLWALLIYKAYSGSRYRLPVVGGVAERFA